MHSNQRYQVAAKEFKIPKTIGACSDLLYKLRAKRLVAQAAADKIKVNEELLKTHIINTLPKSEVTGVAGRFARVSISPKDVPQVEDWPLFYEYLLKSGEFDLLQRRLSDGAVKDRWDDGVVIPGVKKFRVITVSSTKI